MITRNAGMSFPGDFLKVSQMNFQRRGTAVQMNFQLNVLGLQHIGIPTQVFEETVDFYKSLGLEPYYNARISESNFRVAFLRMGKITIEVYETKNTEHKSGAINHIALDVRDIDAAWQQVQALSLRCVDEQVRFLPFFEHGIRFFTIVGPNCEQIEFSQIL